MDLQWVQRARGAQRETRMIESLLQELGVDEGCTAIAQRVREGQVGVHKALPVAVCFSHAKLIAVCRDELIGPRQAANILCSSVRAGLFQSYCEQVVSHIIGDYRSARHRTVCGLPLSSLSYLCTFLPDASLASLRLVSRSCYVAATHAVAQRPFPCTLTVVLEARGRRPQQKAASGFVHSTLGRDHTLPALLHYLHTDKDMAQFAGAASGVGFEGAPEGVAAAAAAATGAPAPAAPTYFVATSGVSVVLPMAVVALRNVGGLRGEGGLGRAEVAAGRIATRLVERVVAEWEHALEASGGEGAVRRDVLESLLWYLDDDGVRGGGGGGGGGGYEVPLEVTRHLLNRTVPLVLPLFRPSPVGGEDRTAQALLVAEGLEALCRWCCRLRQTRLLVDVFATPALAGVLREPLRQSRRRRDVAEEEEEDDLCLADVMPFLFVDASVDDNGCCEGFLTSFLQLAALYKQPDALRLGLSLLEEGGGSGCGTSGGEDGVRAAFGAPDAASGSTLLHFLFEPVKGKQGGGSGDGAVACLRLLLPHLVARPELLLTKTAQRRPPVCALLEGVAGGGRHLPGAREMLQILKAEGCVKGSLPLYWCMEALHTLPPSAAAQVEELFRGLVDAGCAASASLGTGVVLAHLEAAAAKPNGLCRVAAVCSDEGCMTQAADSDLSTARCCRLKTMRVLQELTVSTTCVESPTSASVPDDWEAET